MTPFAQAHARGGDRATLPRLPADGTAPEPPRLVFTGIAAPPQSVSLIRYLPAVLAVTALVTVVPFATVVGLRAAGVLSSSLAATALAVVLSLVLSRAMSAFWRTRLHARDLLFSELLLWGFIRRVRCERALAHTTDLLAQVPGDGTEELPLDMHQRVLAQLAGALEGRDQYLNGHSRRVARHATMIARELGLPTLEIERIRAASALHDVGKLRTPTAILNKPARLTDAEFDVIKRHPVDGAEMVAPLGDHGLTAIVRHHHERLDGSGYPDGLQGERIPLGARIVAVADTFDAITSARAYRAATPHKTAIDILRSNAGTQLDPNVVRAFLAYYTGSRPAAMWAFIAGGARQAFAWLGGEPAAAATFSAGKVAVAVAATAAIGTAAGTVPIVSARTGGAPQHPVAIAQVKHARPQRTGHHAEPIAHAHRPAAEHHRAAHASAHAARRHHSSTHAKAASHPATHVVSPSVPARKPAPRPARSRATATTKRRTTAFPTVTTQTTTSPAPAGTTTTAPPPATTVAPAPPSAPATATTAAATAGPATATTAAATTGPVTPTRTTPPVTATSTRTTPTAPTAATTHRPVGVRRPVRVSPPARVHRPTYQVQTGRPASHAHRPIHSGHRPIDSGHPATPGPAATAPTATTPASPATTTRTTPAPTSPATTTRTTPAPTSPTTTTRATPTPTTPRPTTATPTTPTPTSPAAATATPTTPAATATTPAAAPTTAGPATPPAGGTGQPGHHDPGSGHSHQ